MLNIISLKYPSSLFHKIIHNMKKKLVIPISCLLAALPFAGFAQQKSSGVVTYQVTMQRGGPAADNSNNASAGNDNNDDNSGNVFTMTRSFTFNSTGGKMSSPSFEGRPRRGGQSGNAADQGRRPRRGSMSEYVNFGDKKYLRAFKHEGSDTTFYMPQDYRTAENFQASDKTKKIAGYTCHKATAQVRNTDYTIWYTTDIPETYSPVNGLVPPNGGFVLALQSDRMGYRATAVDLKDVADTSVQIPSPSHELTTDEMRSMRRSMFQRRRNQQNQ